MKTEQLKRLQELFNYGLSDAAIGEQMGYTVSSIENARTKLGLRRKAASTKTSVQSSFCSRCGSRESLTHWSHDGLHYVLCESCFEDWFRLWESKTHDKALSTPALKALMSNYIKTRELIA